MANKVVEKYWTHFVDKQTSNCISVWLMPKSKKILVDQLNTIPNELIVFNDEKKKILEIDFGINTEQYCLPNWSFALSFANDLVKTARSKYRVSERDKYNREWLIENSINICDGYEYGVLTLRALHYRLVSIGMFNTTKHYKRLVAAMGVARRDGRIEYEQFSDHERETIGETKHESKIINNEVNYAKRAIKHWMEYHHLNRWQNQPFVPEVWIEKKALQGTFEPVCSNFDVALSPTKGYPSLTFLNEAKERFLEVEENGQTPIILYFGDYDASGVDIPRSIQENLFELGVDVEVKRILLLKQQVLDMDLPIAPTKLGDSRAKNWDGIGQVELDAVEPSLLQDFIKKAINDVFDNEIYENVLRQEKEEQAIYKQELKEYVKELSEE